MLDCSWGCDNADGGKIGVDGKGCGLNDILYAAVSTLALVMALYGQLQQL